MTTGRPLHAPTVRGRQKVVNLASRRVTHREIAGVMGIARATLELHYREELEQGAAHVQARRVVDLFRMAQGSNRPVALKATIYVLRRWFGGARTS